MSAIGGYFGLELSKGGESYHQTPYTLKSGRAALHCILLTVCPRHIYVPFYTCDALLEPIKSLAIPYSFYAIDENLDPLNIPAFAADEYLVYINYFDLKRSTVARLSQEYGSQLIVDCTQAFFMKGNNTSWFFNSCRKFFGVPDGSYLYMPRGIELEMPATYNELYTVDHLVKRFNGYPGDGYGNFTDNERMAGAGILQMSKLSNYLLSNIDYTQVAAMRRANFSFLDNIFRSVNLSRLAIDADSVPMCYPLLLDKKANKTALAGQEVFIPSFWNDTLTRVNKGYDFEKKYTQYMLPLPVDHHCTTADMQRMADLILANI